MGELKTSYTFRPKVKESQLVIDFLTNQSNFNDAIRYLIEKEIAENGIRDLSTCIPSIRDFSPINKAENKNIAEPSSQKAAAINTAENIIAISKDEEDPEENKTNIKEIEIKSMDEEKNIREDSEIPDCYT